MTGRAVGVPDDENLIEVMYTDDDKAMSFARDVKMNKGHDAFSKKVDDLRKLDGLNQGMKSKMTRRINKYLRGSDKKAKSKTHTREELVTGYGVFETVAPLYNLEYLAKLYEINPTHYAAINAKVANVISLGYHWEETQKTQDRVNQRVSNGDEAQLERLRRKLDRIRGSLDEWLEDLNEEDTWIEILEKVYADREIMGVGYLEVGRKANGEVGYVGHVPAHTIRMRRGRDGYVQIVSNKVTFFRNFGDRETVDPIGDDPQPNEIIPFRRYSPRSTYYGVPDIVSALGAVAGAEFANRFNLDYFEHKAVPRYIILVKGAKLDPKAEKKLIDFFQNNLKGEHHRSVYIPLPPPVVDGEKVEFEIVPVEAKVQDASFQKYHDMNRAEILMAHRVPASKVGLSTEMSLAASREADKMFKEQVTRPVQQNIETKLKPLIREITDVYNFKLNELTLTDEETQSKILERYVRLGVVLRNEAREDLGLKGIPEGDKMVDMFDKSKPGQQAAETRSQTRRGRQREQADDNGPNNSDPSNRNTDGEGSARNE